MISYRIIHIISRRDYLFAISRINGNGISIINRKFYAIRSINTNVLRASQ